MQIIIIAFLLYLLYRFVVGFLLPVFKTAGHVKQQFNAMKNQMDGQYQTHENQSNTASSAQTSHLKKWSTSGKKGSKEDYIDYEDVK